ncbi:MAG: hypothetical protein HY722_11980 [Planctomycetes bacterium]|nr:hypothetical protein [Planctomycetota bacterium]
MRGFRLLATALLLASVTGCTSSGERERVGQPSRLEGRYTCRVHPEVRQSAPGDCPVCGEPLERDGAGYGRHGR